MAINTTKTSDDQAKRSIEEEGNSHSHQEATSSDQESSNNDPQPQTLGSSNNEESSDPLKSTHQQQEEAIDPCDYDPENPMPYFLAQEAKYTAKDVKDRSIQEFRVADVENLLSCKSIFCWSLLTIVLVGGSLIAVILTVDWNATGDGDADDLGGNP